mgnify:CR=1 FL=1
MRDNDHCHLFFRELADDGLAEERVELGVEAAAEADERVVRGVLAEALHDGDRVGDDRQVREVGVPQQDGELVDGRRRVEEDDVALGDVGERLARGGDLGRAVRDDALVEVRPVDAPRDDLVEDESAAHLHDGVPPRELVDVAVDRRRADAELPHELGEGAALPLPQVVENQIRPHLLHGP